MNRSISLAEHHARRRKARSLRDKDDCNSSSSSSNNSDHTGVAHDAACLGAYEAYSSTPSRTNSRGRLRGGNMDAEHASYAAEQCIGDRLPSKRGVVSIPARASFSSPDLDLEDVSRYDSVTSQSIMMGGGGASRFSQRGGDASRGNVSYSSSVYSQNNISRGSGVAGTSVSRASYASASDDSFVSVDVGYDSATRYDASTIATNSILEERGLPPSHHRIPRTRSEEEDAIRAGIVDISVFIATWLAGGLSFVIGLFLTIVSPFIRIIKLIFGDLTGLIGDAVGLALRNNPGLSRDLEGLTRIFKNFSSPRQRWRRQGSSREVNSPPHQGNGLDRHNCNDDCEASMGSVYTNSTYDSHATDDLTRDSPQYVGGWSPSIASSRGSNSRGSYPSTGSAGYLSTGIAGQSYGSGRQSRSRSSKSYISLPQVEEDDVSSCPSYSYYPDDVSVGTSVSTDSRRLLQRVGGGRGMRGSRRGSHH